MHLKTFLLIAAFVLVQQCFAFVIQERHGYREEKHSPALQERKSSPKKEEDEDEDDEDEDDDEEDDDEEEEGKKEHGHSSSHKEMGLVPRKAEEEKSHHSSHNGKNDEDEDDDDDEEEEEEEEKKSHSSHAKEHSHKDEDEEDDDEEEEEEEESGKGKKEKEEEEAKKKLEEEHKKKGSETPKEKEEDIDYEKHPEKASEEIEEYLRKSFGHLPEAMRQAHDFGGFKVPQLEPFKLNAFEAHYTGADFSIKDASLKGLANFEVKLLKVDLAKKLFHLILDMKKLTVDGIYNLKGRLMQTFPVTGNGKFEIVLDNLELDMETAFNSQPGEAQQIHKLRMNTKFASMKANFEHLMGGQFISKQIHKSVNSWGKQIYDTIQRDYMDDMQDVLVNNINLSLKEFHKNFGGK